MINNNIIRLEWNEYSKKLNQEFGGKQLWHCHALNGKQFLLGENAFYICGQSPNQPIKVCSSTPSAKFSAKDFLSGIAGIIRANQTASPPCQGCPNLKRQLLPDEFIASYFSTITMDNFFRCNSRCIYCSYYAKHGDSMANIATREFNYFSFFQQFVQNHFIKAGQTVVEWGGGECTLLDSFDEASNYLCECGVYQTINTSGIIYSKTIEKLLELKMGTVRISIDSGTSEVYLKVKRTTKFADIWDNIGKYTKADGYLIVKYIVFALNSHLQEISAFVNKCKSLHVKKICISTDFHSVYAPHEWQVPYNNNITTEVLTAAAYLNQLAAENDIESYFETIWGNDHLNQIEKIQHKKNAAVVGKAKNSERDNGNAGGIISALQTVYNKIFNKTIAK